MKHAATLVLIFIATVLASASTASGSCESIQDDSWESWESSGVAREIKLKTCIMKTTVIDSPEFMITSARDESVGGFDAFKNKKLVYLPSNIGEKFPNLTALDASNCSIKTLSKENFKDISQLRHLDLSGNQIVTINDDTFDYIPAVEEIILWSSKITKVNGIAFTALTKLIKVDLNDNECIDESFDSPARIAELTRAVTVKCGFSVS